MDAQTKSYLPIRASSITSAPRSRLSDGISVPLLSPNLQHYEVDANRVRFQIPVQASRMGNSERPNKDGKRPLTTPSTEKDGLRRASASQGPRFTPMNPDLINVRVASSTKQKGNIPGGMWEPWKRSSIASPVPGNGSRIPISSAKLAPAVSRGHAMKINSPDQDPSDSLVRKNAAIPPGSHTFPQPGDREQPIIADGKLHLATRQDSAAAPGAPEGPDTVESPASETEEHDASELAFERTNSAEGIEHIDWQVRHSICNPENLTAVRRELSGPEYRALSRYDVSPRPTIKTQSTGRRKTASKPEDIRRLWSREPEEDDSVSIKRLLKRVFGGFTRFPSRSLRLQTDAPRTEAHSTGIFENVDVFAMSSREAAPTSTLTSGDSAEHRDASNVGPFELAAGEFEVFHDALSMSSRMSDDQARKALQAGMASSSASPVATVPISELETVHERCSSTSTSPRHHSVPTLCNAGRVRPLADIPFSEIQLLWLQAQRDARVS